jgi:hypothetical protein
MSVAKKSNAALWEKAKAQAKARMGGKHSARAMQLAVSIYKKSGGKYKGAKTAANKLAKWTKQKWRTKSGKPSGETGERYLPEKAIKALTPSQYAATTAAKRKGTKQGKQFVKQPKSIAKKVKPFRK